MNRSFTALFAALEALLVVGIGIGIPLVPLTFMWAFHYGLQLDWTVFWRAAVDFWLVGHGADVTLTLDPVTAASAGFAGAGTPFVISIAALGIGLLTLLLAVRAGRRIAETPYAKLGSAVALVTVGVVAFGITFSALHANARPSLWQGALLPTLVFATGLLIGLWVAEHRLRGMPGRVARRSAVGAWWASQSAMQRGVLTQSVRGGVAAVAIVMLVSSLLLTVMLLANYAQVIALYEGIHSGVLGGIAVTLAELAFLPNLLVWTASWLIGPGFAIGVGSSVGPLGTSLGPLPAVPVLGALPTGDLPFGFLGLLVPIVAAFLVGALLRPAVLRNLEPGRSPLGSLLSTGIGIGIVGGVAMGILAWVSSGAAGPGRLAEVGPDAILVGLFAALEFGVPAMLGLLVSRPSRAT